MCSVRHAVVPQERTEDWQKRFGSALGLTCRELTGDSDDLANDLDTADIICITPEKFDALTRKHKDQGGMRFFGEVSARHVACMWMCLCLASLRMTERLIINVANRHDGWRL